MPKAKLKFLVIRKVMVMNMETLDIADALRAPVARCSTNQRSLPEFLTSYSGSEYSMARII